MKFNINKYMGNYAMHCKTKEEAKIFCRYLDSVGRKWVDGTSYMSMTKWSVHGPDTCYDFCNGTYCNKTCDRVKVIDTGRAYSSYAEWVTKNAPEFAVYYVYTLYYADIYKKLGISTFTVVAKAPHTDFADRTLYLIQDEFARCFLFDEEGLKKCD